MAMFQRRTKRSAKLKNLTNYSLDLASKIVLAHKGYPDKQSESFYRENSVDVCKTSSVKDYIKIIELDVRKSKDGILYCYHGTLFQYYFSLKIPRTFSDLKKKYNIDSLYDILAVIPESKIIYLDIKSDSISKVDILNALAGKKFQKIILGHTSFSSYFLRRFDNMPENFVKVMNGNILCKFYDLEKLKNENYKYFEVVFPFQVSRKTIEKVEENGMEFRCAGLFFRNKESYWDKINKYGIKHVSSDYI